MTLFSMKDNNFLTKIKNNLSYGTLGIIIVILLFLSASLYFYYRHVPKPDYKPNREHMLNDGSITGMNPKDAEIMLFYVDWCPYCKTAKPQWDLIKNEYSDKTINGYRVIFSEINCTTDNPEIHKMMDTYKIEGYPTIKLLKDNQIIEFDAKPTKDNLEQFLNTVL